MLPSRATRVIVNRKVGVKIAYESNVKSTAGISQAHNHKWGYGTMSYFLSHRTPVCVIHKVHVLCTVQSDDSLLN